MRRNGEPNKGKQRRNERWNFQQKQAAEKEKCTTSGKQQVSAADNGLQSAEISSDKCATCLDLHKADNIDGVLVKEWIQCTNLEASEKWMHCSSGLWSCSWR